jgi:NodT family efflux transporter outer membrane factor (OMF) lipoprotein
MNRPVTSRWWILIVMLPLAGCTLAEGWTSPVPWFANESAQKAEILSPEFSETQRWWVIFNDPLMDQLADKLLSQNLDMQIAEARVREARALNAAVASGLFPQVNLGGSAARENRQLGATKPASILEGGFDATWEIDLFGATRSAIEASEARSRAMLASAEDVRNRVLAELLRSILVWRQSNETLRVTRALIEVQDEQVAIFAARVNGGLIGDAELARARAQREQTAVALPLARAERRSAQYQIEALMGQKPGSLSAFLKPHADTPLNVPPVPELASYDVAVIRARPDVRAAREEMIAAQADLAVAEAKLWPSINIGSFFGLRDVSGKVSTAENPIWSLAADVSAPLLDFGRLSGQVDASNARAEAATLRYEQKVIGALQEARTAFSETLESVNAMRIQQRALEGREDASNLEMDRFRNGLTDMTNLTTAETERVRASLQLILARGNAANASIRYHKALGLAVLMPKNDETQPADVLVKK